MACTVCCILKAMVNYNIKGTGLDVSDELRGYVEKKLAGAEKFLQGDTTAQANVECEYSELRDGPKYRAEFTVSARGTLYRTEEWGTTLHEAIDLTIEQLIKKLRRTKSRHMALVRRGGAIIKDTIRGLRDRF